jgi:hypothetical protein
VKLPEDDENGAATCRSDIGLYLRVSRVNFLVSWMKYKIQNAPNKRCQNLLLRKELLPSTGCSLYYVTVGEMCHFISCVPRALHFSLCTPVSESPSAVTLFSICHLSLPYRLQWPGAAGEPARLYSPSISRFSFFSGEKFPLCSLINRMYIYIIYIYIIAQPNTTFYSVITIKR